MNHRNLFISSRDSSLKQLTVCLLVVSFLAPGFMAYAQEQIPPPSEPAEPAPETPIVETTSPSEAPTEQPVVETSPEQPAPEAQLEEAPVEEGENMAAFSMGETSDLPSRDRSKDDVQRTTLQPDFFGGALNYKYKLDVPPGRNGLTPSVTLSYNNQTADDVNAFGYGWSLDIPYIERVNKTGSQNLYTESYFTSSIDGELATTSASTTIFAVKSDDGSFRSYSYANNNWIVKDKAGTQYLFGYASTTRIDNPNDSSKIYRWMLQEVRDKNGNYITYEYTKDSGYIYPSRILYTGNDVTDGIFEVSFTKVDRGGGAYFATSTRSAFAVVAKYIITEAQAKINGSWVRKYVFAYTSSDNGNRKLLDTITESARDDAGNTLEYPAVNFDYQATIYNNNQEYNPDSAIHGRLPQYFARDAARTDQGVRIADVNGDALPDFIWSELEGASSSTKKVYINDGDLHWNEDSSWQFPLHFVKDGVDDGVRLADVNGDLLIDILWSINAGNGSTTQKTYLNTGTGWAESATWQPPEYFIVANKDNGVRIADINGDGLADVLYGNASSTTTYNKIYLNNGNGWTLSSWSLPYLFVKDGADFGTRTIDLNNDGMMDIMTAYKTTGTSTLQTVISQGDGNWYRMDDWIAPVWFVDYTDTTNYDRAIRFADINGDNLPDFVMYAHVSGANSNRSWISTGRSWTEDYDWRSPALHMGANQLEDGARIADVDGDGMPDVLHSVYRTASSTENRVLLNPENRADVLTKITNGKGGISNITYKQTPLYKFGSNLTNPTLPFVLDTVSNIKNTNGANSIIETKDITYSGGLFYFNNGNDRKFSGFASTTLTSGLGFKTKTYYHQGSTTDSANGEYNDDVSKIGKPYRVEVTDASDNLYWKQINKWENVSEDSGRWNFVTRTQSIDWSQDGDADSKKKAESYAYDPNTGNLSEKILYGEVSASDDGTITDTGTDKFTLNYKYATSSPAGVNLLSQETLYDQNSNKVKETKLYYDTLSHGSVTLGNVTKDERWATTTDTIDFEKTYNSYGLVTQDKDPRDKTTDYVYDSYNLYPATTTNALSQSFAYTYDYSSGKVATTTDPNGRIFANVYDAFDRVTEQKQPDVSTPSTLVDRTTYAYTDAPTPRKIVKTDYLDASTTVATYTYLDGFDRIAQERKQAESPNSFVAKDYVYNTAGLLDFETLPYFSNNSAMTSTSTSGSSIAISYTYDPLSRVTKITNAVGSTTNSYDDWTATTTDARFKQRALYKDAFGNLIRVDEVNGASTYSTYYDYNGIGSLTKITDALGNVRNFTYNGLGRRLTAEDLHAPGDASFGTWTYSYDDSGNLTSTLDPKSQTVNYTYDDINRPLTENYTGTAGTEVSYTYDSCTNGIGHLCIATSTGAVATYTYDALGRVATENKNINSNSLITTYTSDRLGNITNIVYPNSVEVKNTYNSAGLVDRVEKKESAGGSFTGVVDNIDYAPNSQPSLISYSNGTESQFFYNPDHLYRLERKLTAKTSGTGGEGYMGYMSQEDYLKATQSTYDERGNAMLKEPFEDEDLRTPESKTSILGFAADGGEYRETTIYSGPIFYKNNSGKFAPINTNLTKSGDEWFMFDAPYRASLKGTPTESPFTFSNDGELLSFSFPAASTSTDSSKIEETKAGDWAGKQVTYKDYLGPGIDMVVTVNDDALIKDFIIQSKSALGELKGKDYFEIPFEITGIGSLDAEIDGKLLSKEGSITSSSTARLIEDGKTAAYIWMPLTKDAKGNEFAGHSINIDIRYELLPTGSLKLTKLIPVSWLSQAVYPVKSDAVISVYASAGDGSLEHYGSDVYATERNGATATSNGGTDTSGSVQVLHWGFVPHYGLYRGFLPFNTSVIGSNASITAATLYTYAEEVFDASDIALVHTDQASGSSLANGDYDNITLNNPVEGAVRQRNTSWSLTDYTPMYLNSNGLSWISSTSTTFLGLRSSLDVDNVIPSSYSRNGIAIFYSEKAGTSKDPYLKIRYFHASSTDLIQDLAYTYDAVGNITKIVDQSGTNSKKTLDLTYDDLNRLTQASTTLSTFGGNYLQTFSYDALGNLTNKSDRGAYTYSSTGNANPHAVTDIAGVTITYDNNGNLLGMGTATSTWDYANRITQIDSNATTTKYTYDHLGQRVKYQTGSTITYYPSPTYDITSTTTQGIHIMANNMLLASINATGTATTTFWVHGDQVGNSTAITNSTPTLEELNDYYPFGELRFDQKSTSYQESKKFIGQEYDDDTSLSYLNARYYDGRSGRFQSGDPVFVNVNKLNLANPQEQNSYSYALNNPFNALDPSGTTVELVSRPIGNVPILGPIVGMVGAHAFVKITPENPRTIGNIIDGEGHNFDTSTTFTLAGTTSADEKSLVKDVNGDLGYTNNCGACASVTVNPPTGVSQEDFEKNIVANFNKLPNTLRDKYSMLGNGYFIGGSSNSNNAATTILMGGGVRSSLIDSYQNQLMAPVIGNHRYTPGLGEPIGSSGLSRQVSSILSELNRTLNILSKLLNKK